MNLQPQNTHAAWGGCARAAAAFAVTAWLACGTVSVFALQQPAPAPAATTAPAAQPVSAEPGAAPASAETTAPHAAEPSASAEGHAKEAGEHGQEATGHGKEAGEHGEGEAAESPWALVARIVNFAILAGGLVYLLRSPLVGYLEQRGVTVRSELTKAAELKKEAGAQIAEIEAKMQALPTEIDALKRRGAEEIAAEEARIRALAETERARLVEQAKREIDTQLRLAERDLKTRAGELAVEVATARVKQTITDRDQTRLVERYVSQVRN
jgi:F-type H+-transporting ATPase subunit b